MLVMFHSTPSSNRAWGVGMWVSGEESECSGGTNKEGQVMDRLGSGGPWGGGAVH